MASVGRAGGRSRWGVGCRAVSLARERCRVRAADARAATPRYRSAGGDPPLRATRHRAMRDQGGSPRRGGCQGKYHSERWFLPSIQREIIRGATTPRQGRSLRSRRLLRSRRPLTGPGREFPGPLGACRVEGEEREKPCRDGRD
jgi:hypothetical protein